MNINDLTIGQAKELSSMFSKCNGVSVSPSTSNKRHDFEVGKKYFVRTVTNHYLGEVVEVNELCVVMVKVTWVADDGRFHKAMQGEWDSNAEHEPYPENMRVQLFYGAMLDANDWHHEIIKIVKG